MADSTPHLIVCKAIIVGAHNISYLLILVGLLSCSENNKVSVFFIYYVITLVAVHV